MVGTFVHVCRLVHGHLCEHTWETRSQSPVSVLNVCLLCWWRLFLIVLELTAQAELIGHWTTGALLLSHLQFWDCKHSLRNLKSVGKSTQVLIFAGQVLFWLSYHPQTEYFFPRNIFPYIVYTDISFTFSINDLWK